MFDATIEIGIATSRQAQWVGCCRFVWNWFLQQRQDLWRAVKDLPEDERREALRIATFAGQSAQLPALKKHFPWLADCPADRAFTHWWQDRAMRPDSRRKTGSTTPSASRTRSSSRSTAKQ